MTNESKPEARQDKEPELKRPNEAIRDLEPDDQEAQAITGGISVNTAGLSKI